MKTIITDTGWKEITTKEFKIIGKRWDDSFFGSITTKEWIESNKRSGTNKSKHRKTCQCCHRNWEDLPGKVSFFTTDKGNKAICEECVMKISKGEVRKMKIVF